MVSTLPLCLFILVMTVVSSQDISGDSESFEQTPISERRLFKHKKPLKVLPLIKKHKKFGGWLPSVFGKTEYAEVPVFQEIPLRPIYKFQRYQGIEVKPVSDVRDVSISGPETIVDGHSVGPSSDYAPAYTSDHDYAHTFGSDHSFPPAPPPSSSFFLYPVNDKPIFSGPSFPAHVFPSPAPSAPVFDSIPSHPRPVFSYVPAPSPSPPVFSSVPITLPPVSLPPAPVFSTVSIAKPAPSPIISTPVQPAPPVLPVLPAPLPPSFALPLPAPAPAPAPVFSFPVKFPPPILSVPSPAPVLSPHPSPAPVISSLPPLASPALSIPASPEPEFPYPPSGTPIPSYIKDISLPEISVTPTPTPTSVTVVTPHYDEVTPTVGDVGNTKTFDHGLLQKLKDWKAEKANQALSHFTYFKPKPAAIPTLASPHQFHSPIHPLPLTPDFRPHPAFFPQSAPVFSPAKYENFPPNNIESPPLFDSYGAPIPHDSYATIHSSHDRLSPEASEEDPSILPPPFGESKPESNPVEFKKPDNEQPQLRQPQNFKPQALLPQEQPIYVPEENQKITEEIKTIEEVVNPVRNSQPEGAEEPEDANLQHHRNHKE